MKLTGQCKDNFQMWYFNKFCNSGMKYHELLPHHMNDVFGWFYGLDSSFKGGVFIEVLDSLGIIIEIEPDYYDGWNFGITITKPDGSYVVIATERKRTKAQTVAIEKANEIYNNRSST